MIRHPRTLAVPVFMLVALLALAACGGGSTPAGSSEPGATQVAGSTTAPAATSDAAPSEAAATLAPTAGGAVNLGDAAASLENLDNYSFKMEMKAEGGSRGMMGMVTSGGSIVMEGDLQLKPVEAADITMTLGDGSQSTDIGYRIIGDKAYMNLGGDSWMAAPAEDAASTIDSSWMAAPAEDAASTIDSLKPDKLLKGYATSDMSRVGEEDKNGIPSVHYQSTMDPGVGSMLGLPTATWTIDTWLAKDGGFPVSAMIVATGQNEAGEAGSFSVSLDVTGINDPNLKIEAPANVQEMPG
jgi:hypothetical protein